MEKKVSTDLTDVVPSINFTLTLNQRRIRVEVEDLLRQGAVGAWSQKKKKRKKLVLVKTSNKAEQQTSLSRRSQDDRQLREH
jgi:hypothetical protein